MMPPRKKKEPKSAPDKTSKRGLQSFQTKFAAFFEKFKAGLIRYEECHPEWQFECLYSLMAGSLQRLKDCIESKKDTEISWRRPYVELKFPVEVKWLDQEGEETFQINAGTVTPEDLRTNESEFRCLTRLMVRQLEITTLQLATQNAAYAQKGKRYTPMLGPDERAHLKSLKSDEERGEALNSILQPCSFGAGTISLPKGIKPGDAVPASITTQLAKFQSPLLSIPWTLPKLGAAKLFVIFEVHPVVVNFFKRTAHFPFVVGLSVLPDQGSLTKPPGHYLAAISTRERTQIWKLLFEAIAAQMETFWPKKKPEVQEAIIQINASIKVRYGEPVSLADLPGEALRQLQKVGEIMSFQVQSETEVFKRLGPEFATMLAAVDTARSPAKKGTALERLMMALFSSINGFHTRSRVRTQTEEIDILIENQSGDALFKKEGSIILVECKNWSTKCSKNDFLSFREKMLNRRGRCTLGFLVSWNGFPRTIGLEMLRKSQETPLVILLERSKIANAVERGNFLDCLLDGWREALKV